MSSDSAITTDKPVVEGQPVGDPTLWFGALAGPIAWGLRLLIAYPLVYVACSLESMIPIHVVSLAMAALSVAGAVVSWRSWRALGGDSRRLMEGPLTRDRFMAFSGVAFGIFFLVVILVEWSPSFFVDPCAEGLS
jgi:hypothetical protein